MPFSLRRRPVLTTSSILLALTVGMTASLWLGTNSSRATGVLLLCWLASINVMTFAAMGCDKRFAASGTFRLPEATLHLVILVGGSVGAAVAMRAFRHKTTKRSFRIVFGLLLVIHASAGIGLVWLLSNW